MTINASVPVGTDLVSSLDSYIRDDRAQINELWTAVVAANATETAHVMGAGEFALVIGTDLDDVILELVDLTAAVAVDLMQITEGSGGMIKVIRAGDGNVTVKHNASYISLVGSADLTMTAGDILVLVNSGGDPDTSVNGVWYEVVRGGTGTGQSNTASNVGTGDGDVFKQKVGVDLELKTIKAGSNITITNGASDITIAAAGSVGETNTASNVGAGGGEIYKQKTGVDIELKTLLAGSNITITNNASDITIESTASGGSANTAVVAALGVGDSTLVGGADIGSAANNEVVTLSASTAETLATIANCTSGAIRHILVSGANISISNNGNLVLRQPAATTIALDAGDVISLVNVGGVVGGANGTWHETSRSLAI